MINESINNFIDTACDIALMLKQGADALRSIADFKPISEKALRRFHGLLAYEVAGRPYGKNIRGFKKWRKGLEG
jgi:hypothetical protein